MFYQVWPHFQTSEMEFRVRRVTYVRLNLCSSLGSSGRRWTPYLLSSNRTPSLKIQRPPVTYPAVPPGTCSSPSRVGKRPRMRHFNVALRLHRTFYRKLPDEQVWHFCRNCPNWPRAGYEERDNRNPPHEFCRGCIEMHHEEACEWANVELSPARSYRGWEIH